MQYEGRWRPAGRASWVWLGLFAAGAIACGSGPTMGENEPGGDTNIDPGWGPHVVGAIAVQPDESRAWFAHRGTRTDEASGAVHTRAFFSSVDTTTGVYGDIFDVTDFHDLWVLFPQPQRGLLFAENAEGESATLIDAGAMAVLDSQLHPGKSWRDPHTAPSGRFTAVIDEHGSTPGIDVIDTATLTATSLLESPYVTAGVELRWTNSADQLIAVHGATTSAEWGASRILGWKFEGGIPPAQPWLEIDLPDLCVNFSSRIIAVSPDDRWAVFTLIDCPTASDPLIVIDLTEGSYRISSALGPVSFTPDSSTIVSHDFDADGNPALRLISVATLESELVTLPAAGAFEFFVTAEGNQVVCSPLWSTGGLVIYDATTGATTALEGPHVSMHEFVERPGHQELWLSDMGTLYRLGLAELLLDPVELDFPVDHLNILPQQDRLVMTEANAGMIRFFSMSGMAVDLEVPLVSPLASSATPPRFETVIESLEPVSLEPDLR